MYEDMTYEAILKDGKNQISDNILKNEGSLVHNALSIIAFELEKFYIQADYMLDQIDPETADYENLVKLCSQRGIYPSAAMAAKVKITSNTALPIGSRFNLSAYNYVITEEIDTLTYAADCETAGSGANGLMGDLTPITYIDGLENAKITEVIIPGTDASSKEDLLRAYKDSFDNSSFGGNVAEYKKKINAFDGVGGCKIYPVWNGGGTVKVAVIGSDYNAASEYLVSKIQEDVCPTPKKGYGIAAIGHDVTVESVKPVTVNITTKVSFMTGYSKGSTGDAITKALQEFFLSLRKSWSDGDENNFITVYISRIESVILSVEGVLDVNDTSLNGAKVNLSLQWDEIPKMGDLTYA